MSEPLLQTGVDDVHAHAHKTGHTWVDLAMAISAITISIISLFVAVAHGRTEEKLVAASSWPFLTFSTSKNGLEAGGWTIDLRLQNSGVGPARVKWIRLVLDGKPVRDSADLMKRCCGVPSAPVDEQVRRGLVSQNSPVGVLPAREGVDVLAWRERSGNGVIWSKLGERWLPAADRGLLLLGARRLLDQRSVRHGRAAPSQTVPRHLGWLFRLTELPAPPHARPCVLRSGDRQQASWLRRGESQDWRSRAGWPSSQPCHRRPGKDG